MYVCIYKLGDIQKNYESQKTLLCVDLGGVSRGQFDVGKVHDRPTHAYCRSHMYDGI